MKYVMFKRQLKDMTLFHPVIFPNHLVHADVAADLMKGSLQGFTVDSAGEWNMMYGCSGMSTTLQISANKERDTRIILMNDYGAGLQ